MAFTTDNWVGGNADWGASAANWSHGFPNANSNVAINAASVVVTYVTGDAFTVNSLTVGGTDQLSLSGGTLVISTKASFADGFTQTGGTLSVGGAVTVKGTGTLTGGIAQGATALDFSGTVTIANYELTGGASLTNSRTTNQTGQITVESFAVKTAIDNEKGGIYAIEGDFGIGRGPANFFSHFVNAGTLAKTGGTGTSLLSIDVNDTGKIAVAIGGTIEFAGSQNSFAGAISGAGQIYLGAASNSTIHRGTTITAATFTISDSGTVATLDENLALAHTFNLESGAFLDLAGVTLTLSGTDNLGNFAAIGGSGTLATAKGSFTNVNSFVLDGGAAWQNSGTVGGVGILQLGDFTFNAASFVNKKGGVYQFTQDVGIQSGTALNSSFLNVAGATLEKTGGTGTSTISVEVTDNGAIIVQTGTIAFVGPADSFAGAISGNGQFEIGNGFTATNATLEKGVGITAKIFTIDAAAVTLDVGLNYHSGAFNLTNSTLSLGRFSLTVSGTDSLSGGFIDGPGTFITDKNSNVSLSGLTLGTAAKWENFGTVSETGSNSQIGDQTFDSAGFVNEKGGHFVLAGDFGFGIGFNPKSSFVNSPGASFVKQSGSGDSVVGNQSTIGIGVFANNGTVTVDTGTIEFATLVNGKGLFTIDSGTVLQFDAAVAAGSTVKFATHTGGDLVLRNSPSFKAAISGFGGTGTDEIELRDISNATLSYKGTAKQGLLTVTGTNTQTGQAQTDKLTFLGNYKLGNFHASAGPSGGTLIVDPSPHPTLLASAH